MSTKGKIGIIGSGLIGRSWTMLFTGAGYSVCLFDKNHKQLSDALEDIAQQLLSLGKQGLLRSDIPTENQLKAISISEDIKICVKDAIYIQECVWEDLVLKQKIFKELDSITDGEQILASSVSTIPPSLFTSDLKRKEYCIVAHPTNPPFYCPMVELVPNSWTKPEVMITTEKLMLELGQVPVKLKREVFGFASNRMQYALLAECWRLVNEGIMEPEDVDKCFRTGIGLRYAFLGPLEVTHLNAQGVREYCEKYNRGYLEVSEKFGPPPSWEGPLLDKVTKSLEDQVPLEKLPERRVWRDMRLAALAKLKKDFDERTGP